MKSINILITLFLLLMPCEHFQNSGVLCDYARSRDPRKEQMSGNPSSNLHRSPSVPNREIDDPLTVKVHYQSPGREKKMREEKLCRQEIEVIKEMAAKSKDRKSRSRSYESCSPADDIAKGGFDEKELEWRGSMEKVNVLGAECEQCELQVKATGDGVVLKCKDCRELPSSEVIFPAGNNRRIITLP